MALEIDKCRALHNARTRAKNKLEKKPAHIGTLKQQDIGNLFFPGKNYNHVASSMRRMKQESIYIKIEWVKILCEMTGTDANFALGMDSVFDQEYEKYTVKQTQ